MWVFTNVQEPLLHSHTGPGTSVLDPFEPWTTEFSVVHVWPLVPNPRPFPYRNSLNDCRHYLGEPLVVVFVKLAYRRFLHMN